MIYIAMRSDGSQVKIGWTGGGLSGGRVQSHWGMGFDFETAIAGSEQDEGALHAHFAEYRTLSKGGKPHPELFHPAPPLMEWIAYVKSCAWSANSIEEESLTYPSPHRWPWAMTDTRTKAEDVGLFDIGTIPTEARVGSLTHRQLITCSSESDDWYTPPAITDRARRVMGTIDLDPASNPTANQWIQATQIFTQQDDGIRYEWHGNIWLNPPYGASGPVFVDKLLAEIDAARVAQAIVCLNSNSLDARWMQPLLTRFAFCICAGRVNYVGGGDKARKSNSMSSAHGTVLFYAGPNVDRFADEFSTLGNCGTIDRPFRDQMTTKMKGNK